MKYKSNEYFQLTKTIILSSSLMNFFLKKVTYTNYQS